jgi:ABC-type transport system involved in cytochrome c biogenesis permease subunit
MQKLTRFHFVGYLFMVIGIIVAVINCILNINGSQPFGNFYLFIFSGFLAAAGLTMVFNEKEMNKNEQTLSDNKN